MISKDFFLPKSIIPRTHPMKSWLQNI